MPVLHTGGFHHFVLVDLIGNSLVHHQVAQHLQKLFRCDSTGPQQPGTFLCQIHTGGFHTNPAGTAVHHGCDFAVMVMEHMFCGGGGGFSGDVGGRSGDGHTG